MSDQRQELQGPSSVKAERESPVIELINISKRFGKVQALHGIDLKVRRGEFITVLGPSGSGKSTLLRIIAGFESPTTGRVLISGQDMTSVPPEKRPLNMVFQRYALFPHLTVAENIGFGLRLKGMSDVEVQTRVDEALELVQLPGLEGRRSHQLSGGQAQRVALARALVNQPEVLLLDEPLTGLDRKIRMYMQEELRSIQMRVGTTFLYITHDQDEAMAMSERVVLIHEGEINQVASPVDLYWSPSCRFAADFIGDANILEGRVVEVGGQLGVEWEGLQFPELEAAGHVAGDRVCLMVRPEAIQLAPRTCSCGGQWVEGQLERSSFHGFYWIYYVRVGKNILVVREFSASDARTTGGRVRLVLDVKRVVAISESSIESMKEGLSPQK